ncbi:sugar transferase, partial [Humibacter sp.]|uniref:sugar transferase n=1 Tax=Humibacter sp. TaxID=1940291 RepID=UPI002CC497E1
THDPYGPEGEPSDPGEAVVTALALHADDQALWRSVPTEHPHSLATPLPLWRRRYVFSIVVGDFTIATLTGAAVTVASIGNGSAAHNGALTVAIAVAWTLLLWFGRAYEQRFLAEGTEEYRRVASAWLRLVALISFVSFIAKSPTSRLFVGVTVPAIGALSLLLRLGCRTVLTRVRAQGGARHQVVVVGRSDSVAKLAARLRDDPRCAWNVVAICAQDEEDALDVVLAVKLHGADTVAIAADSGLADVEMRRLGWALEGIGVDMMLSTDLIEVAGPRIHVRAVDGMPLLHVSTPQIAGSRRLLKTLMDRGSAMVLILVLSPVFLVLAIAVRTTGRGVIFRQKRVGRAGELFTVYKFRTMTRDAEQRLAELGQLNEHSDGPLFKIRNDPRITSVGKHLRRWSLDELPQLFNVLLGHMSLVGPRPPLPSEVATYGDDVRRRLLVKPGVTGLWQVSGRSDLSWEQSIRLDLSYVENWSMALDLTILWRTLGAVVRGSGSY